MKRQQESHSKTSNAETFDPQPILELIAGIQADLDRLKGMVEQAAPKFYPANPHNKTADGKLSEDGVECCYRMFDEGKSRYSVARSMKISFAAATMTTAVATMMTARVVPSAVR